MRFVFLYHPESDHARQVESYAKEFESRGYGSFELISLESKDGAAMAELYDIVAYPAILAIREGGELQKNWEGDQLPLMSEVASYSMM
ncbi:hypothetical protein KDA00_04535 [Candidatus Saccharibacteria bacterium]|nr:hypothetical protein [Candidatus Saccharibacteria bacterium]